MKKILFVLLWVFLVGCSNKSRPEETTTKEVKPKETYSFKVDNGNISVNMSLENMLKLSGEYKNYIEIPSCLYNGYDMIYVYNGYEVTINEVKGQKYVTKIVIIDDTVTTTEGLAIGDAYRKIEELYGNNYELDKGIYKYFDSKTYLCIGVSAEEVVSIEYKK